MRNIVERKTTRFHIKPVQPKIITNTLVNMTRKNIEEAKRQAYADMGLFAT